MKKLNQLVFTAAVLVALSGLAYSEYPGSSSTKSPDESGTTMGSPAESSPAGDATGIIQEMNKESTPGTGGDLEKNTYSGGSPGGMMGMYSSAKKGGHKLYPDSQQGEPMP